MFYTRYRPRKAADFAGDARHAANALAAWPPGQGGCLMFSGPTGCGKTSCARMFLNRCGVHPDWGVREINCASNDGALGRGFADSLRDWYRLAPMAGVGKAVLLEEAHRLTMSTQETMNELLEWAHENYAHRWTILCTTAPEKIIPALEGRFDHYRIAPPTLDETAALVVRVADREGLALDEDAAREIARKATSADPGGFPVYNLRKAVGLVGRLLVSLSAEAVAVA